MPSGTGRNTESKSRLWTDTDELKHRLRREWDKGNILRSAVGPEVDESRATIFPLRLSLRGPESRHMLDAFDEVRQWIDELSRNEKREGRNGYRLEWREFVHRQLGANRIPVAAVFDTVNDAVSFIGLSKDLISYTEIYERVAKAEPGLSAWLRENPLETLKYSGEWPLLLSVIGWVKNNPRSGKYLRQVDIAGVHSKYIESRRNVLMQLLDAILPAEAVATDAQGSRGFEQHYGFREKPALVRFRVLDESYLERATGMLVSSDITIPSTDFDSLRLDPEYVFITENEINFLSFPLVRRGIVVFGAGYGLDRLSSAKWLRESKMWYWGDIDTHGFAILDQLRSYLPDVTSMLMDRETLLGHRDLWGSEQKPAKRLLSRLTSEEASLYKELCDDVLAPSLRLEQERIGFGYVRAFLSHIS